MIPTPYQQTIINARITLVKALIAQGLRSGAVETILCNYADICQLLQQYQERIREAYAAQQARHAAHDDAI